MTQAPPPREQRRFGDIYRWVVEVIGDCQQGLMRAIERKEKGGDEAQSPKRPKSRKREGELRRFADLRWDGDWLGTKEFPSIVLGRQ